MSTYLMYNDFCNRIIDIPNLTLFWYNTGPLEIQEINSSTLKYMTYYIIISKQKIFKNLMGTFLGYHSHVNVLQLGWRRVDSFPGGIYRKRREKKIISITGLCTKRVFIMKFSCICNCSWQKLFRSVELNKKKNTGFKTD